MTKTDETSSLPSKTLSLSMVSDRTGSYPQLVFGDVVIDTTTVVELTSEANRGQSMRGQLRVTWDESIATLAIEGWVVDSKNRVAVGSYSAGPDVMQQDSAFTVQCTLKAGEKPATDPSSGWVGPNAAGVWTLDPYARIKRKGYTVTQTV